MLSNLINTGDWAIDILKDLTFMLDKAVYGLVKAVYYVFYELAGFNLLGTDAGAGVISQITNRVYVLLGIIMIFILAFNLLNYIVDPDKVNDKQVGAATFIKDVVIALVVISVLPTVFSKLYSFQKVVLEEGVIANLILGGNMSVMENESSAGSPIENGANVMIASVYVAFLRPADDELSALDCDNETIVAENEGMSGYCQAYENAKLSGRLNDFNNHIKSANFDYPPFLTTIGGIALLVFMVIFCFQLAKRIGKLAILQLIAPVPFALEIVPNKKGTRKKWIETLLKVYLDAFVYLMIIYFIILLISLVPAAISGLMSNMNGFFKVIATIILIFGLLMFAKEAPGMLMDLLGIKSSGSIKDSFGMAKKGGAMAAFLGGTAGSFIGSGIRNAVNTEGGFFSRAGSAVAGATSSLGRNIWGARNVHSIRDANNLRRQTNMTVSNNRQRRDAYAAAHPYRGRIPLPDGKLGAALGGILGSSSGHLSEAGYDIKRAGQSFFKGSSGNQERLSTINKVAESAKSGRIRPWTDNLYNNIKTRRDQLKTSDYINAFNKYKSLVNNPNASEKDFVDWMQADHISNNAEFQNTFEMWKQSGLGNENSTMADFLDFIETDSEYSKLKGDFSDIFDAMEAKEKFSAIIDAQNALDNQEAAIFKRESNKLQLQAKDTLLRMEDAGLQELSWDNKDLYKDLKAYFKDDGSIRALNEDDIRNLNSTITNIGKALDQEAFNINMAAMEDKLRDERRNSGSSDKK